VTGVPPIDVPRRNGELVFEAPWESRAFGMVAAYLEANELEWEHFRRHLIAAIAASGADTPYYESWTAALAAMLAADHVVNLNELEDRAARF
jgi:nitrile hydratase accessory protein